MKLRGALLGAGNIALRGHLPQWLGHPGLRESVEIVAVADLSPANLEAARAQLPGARFYQDALALLDAEELDFCDICTPPHTHRALVEAAAARGLAMVCEKPLAPTVADGDAIGAAVREASVVFQPCHQYHHSPQWLAVRSLLGRLGHIHLAEYEVLRTGANEGNANWAPAWRTDRTLAGGGILVDHGAHIFYQLRVALGEPRRVQAAARTLRHHGYGVEDTAHVTLDYDGALASVRVTWAAGHRSISFRFVGDQGELSGDDERVRLRVGDEVEDVGFDDGMSKNSSHSEWYAPLFQQFVEQVRSGEPRFDALEEALSVTRLIARAYESSERGQALPL